jgi:hypothetical protein
MEKIRKQEYNRNSNQQIDKSDPFHLHLLFQKRYIITYKKGIVKWQLHPRFTVKRMVNRCSRFYVQGLKLKNLVLERAF